VLTHVGPIGLAVVGSGHDLGPEGAAVAVVLEEVAEHRLPRLGPRRNFR
jgi:hypothetical protein